MSLDMVAAVRIGCDSPPDDNNNRCDSVVFTDARLGEDAALRAARERGWSTGSKGHRCPRHTAARTAPAS